MEDYEEENRNRIRKFIFRMVGVGLIFICILCFIIPSHALPLEDIIKTDECCMGEDVDYYSTIYYPYNMSDSSLAGYKVIDKNIPYSTEGLSSTILEVQNTEYLIQSFITPINDPYLTSMASGTRRWDSYISVSSINTGDTYLIHKLYKRVANGTETLIYTFPSNKISSTGINLISTSYTMSSPMPMNISDRFVMKYYAKTTSAADITINLYYDGNSRVSKIYSPIAGTAVTVSGVTDHGLLSNLSGDSHIQYLNINGRSGGQVINGATDGTGELFINGSAANNNLIMQEVGGRVGIGTASPQGKLHVNGYMVVSYPSTTNTAKYGYYLMQSYDNTKPLTLSMLAGSGSANNPINIGGGSGSYYSANGIYFYTGTNATFLSGLERMRITSGGNVTIGGITSPTAQFDTNGQVRFRNYGAGTANFDSQGNLYSASDEKVKKDIIKYTDSTLLKIKGIEPIKYKFTKESGLDTENTYLGFSAQNLQKVFPDAVSAKDDIKYTSYNDYDDNNIAIPKIKEEKTGTQTLSISDRAIIAGMINAMKEQQIIIENQEKRIADLEKRLNKIEGVKDV